MKICALNSKRSLVFAGIVLMGVFAFAAPKVKPANENAPLPVVKIPSRVQSLDWNADGTLFSHTEGNTVTIRDGTNFGKVRDLGINGGRITDLKFATNFEGALEQIIMFSETSELSLFKSNGKIPTIIERLPVSSPPPTIEFSDNANYIAVGRKDGGVDIYFQLYMTQNVTRTSYKNPFDDSYNSTVKAMAFSRDSKYLAALQENGRAVVWRISDKQPVARFTNVGGGVNSIEFGGDETLILAKDGKTLRVLTFDGREVLTFATPEQIASFKLSVGGEDLVVLTKDNQFHYYSLKDGSQEGYIPAWNKTEISSYAFSTNGKRLLVGHDDGSIYILDIDRVFFQKGKKPGVYSMYDVDTGKKWNYDADKAVILGKDEMVVKKSAHSLALGLGYKHSRCKYYNHGLETQLEYINDRLVRKFYFGAGIDWNYLVANENYPWEYKIGSVKVRSPNIMGFDLFMLIGKDWQIKKSDFYFFLEGSFGGGLRYITSGALGMGAPNTALLGRANFGFRWKALSLCLNAGYDSVYAFNFGVGLSFKYRFTPAVKKPKTVQSKVTEEEKNAV